MAPVFAQVEASPVLGGIPPRFILGNHGLNRITRDAVKGTVEAPLPHNTGDGSTGYLADACEVGDVAIWEEVGDVLVDLYEQ